VRVVADEGHALRIVADGIGKLEQRRAAQRMDGEGAGDRPCRGQIIDMEIGSQTPSRPQAHDERRTGRAVGRQPAFPAEPVRQHAGGGMDQFAYRQRDHREGRAAAAGGRIPDQRGTSRPRHAAGHGQQHGRKDKQSAIHPPQEVDDGIPAQSRVDGMSERQHPRLPQQQVVRQREQRHRAHLRHQAQLEAAAQAQRRQRQQRQPRRYAGQEPLAIGTRAHVSRTPMSPRGRQTSTATINR